MADMVSRIVFQSTGGDKVAQDISKIKKSFDDASQSKQSFEAGSGGAGGALPTDAFGRATAPPMGLPAPSGYGLPVPSGGGGGGWSFPSPSGGGMMQQHLSKFASSGMNALQAGTSDVVAGGGSALMGLGKLGVAGIIAASVAAVGMGASKIADKDLARRNELWTGLGQSLGQGDYETFREKIKKNEREGFTTTTDILSGMAGAGGAFDEDVVSKAVKLQYATGMNSNVYGSLLGSMQKAGVNIASENGDFVGTQNLMAFQAKSAFGQSGMTDFYSAVTQALESGMERGFQKGSANLTGMYSTMVQGLADYANYGGLTAEGAKSMFRGVRATVARPESGVQSPEDAWRFMMARKPGEEYGDTIRRMTEEGYDKQIYQDIKNRAGGDRASLENMLVQQFEGVTYTNVDAYIKAKEQRLAYDREHVSLTSGDLSGITDMDTDTLNRHIADLLKKNTLEGAESGIGGVFSNLMITAKELATGTYQMSDDAEQGYRDKASAYINNQVSPADIQSYRSMTPDQLRAEGWKGGKEELDVLLELLEASKEANRIKASEVLSDENQTPRDE